MNTQITAAQAQDLLGLSMVNLMFVALRLICLAVWNKWLKYLPLDQYLLDDECDDELISRRERVRRS